MLTIRRTDYGGTSVDWENFDRVSAKISDVNMVIQSSYAHKLMPNPNNTPISSVPKNLLPAVLASAIRDCEELELEYGRIAADFQEKGADVTGNEEIVTTLQEVATSIFTLKERLFSDLANAIQEQDTTAPSAEEEKATQAEAKRFIWEDILKHEKAPVDVAALIAELLLPDAGPDVDMSAPAPKKSSKKKKKKKNTDFLQKAKDAIKEKEILLSKIFAGADIIDDNYLRLCNAEKAIAEAKENIAITESNNGPGTRMGPLKLKQTMEEAASKIAGIGGEAKKSLATLNNAIKGITEITTDFFPDYAKDLSPELETKADDIVKKALANQDQYRDKYSDKESYYRDQINEMATEAQRLMAAGEAMRINRTMECFLQKPGRDHFNELQAAGKITGASMLRKRYQLPPVNARGILREKNDYIDEYKITLSEAKEVLVYTRKKVNGKTILQPEIQKTDKVVLHVHYDSTDASEQPKAQGDRTKTHALSIT